VSKAPLAALTLAGVFALAACGYADPYAASGPVANESPGTHVSPSPGTDDFNAGSGLPVVTYPDGLQMIDLKVGTGDTARLGMIATVQYTGWLTDGTRFDTSRQSGRDAIHILISEDQGLCANAPADGSYACVIPGWTEGIQGMKVGGKRKLIIPGPLAYGSAGKQDPQSGAYIIPPNATLIFQVELISIKAGPTPAPSPTPTPSPSPSPSPSPTKSP